MIYEGDAGDENDHRATEFDKFIRMMRDPAPLPVPPFPAVPNLAQEAE